MPGADVVVVGAGIVGLATARALSVRHPDAAVVVVEKEPAVGRHQTGHNSGVLHSGIYYAPGSLKARLAVEGRRRMVEWCAEHGVPVAITGKLVVAVDGSEVAPLEEIRRRAGANGVEGVEMLDGAGLRSIEPHAAGVAALWVPATGVVDFSRVAATMAAELAGAGVAVRTGVGLTGAVRRPGEVVLELSDGTALAAGRVIACPGLQADRVARTLGLDPPVRIVPFRGEYWKLLRPDLVRGLIYPVPDPRFPFLGVHFTRRIDGMVEAGPNAVPAFAREGYRWTTVSRADLVELGRTPGLGALAGRYWRTAAGEVARSLIPPLLLRAARRLVPAIRPGDLVRAGAGVRAQAVAPDGKLVDDFAIVSDDRVVAVLNAPSPAATASLAIAEEIVARVAG